MFSQVSVILSRGWVGMPDPRSLWGVSLVPDQFQGVGGYTKGVYWGGEDNLVYPPPPPVLTSSDGHISGRYATFVNTFLLLIISARFIRTVCMRRIRWSCEGLTSVHNEYTGYTLKHLFLRHMYNLPLPVLMCYALKPYALRLLLLLLLPLLL